MGAQRDRSASLLDAGALEVNSGLYVLVILLTKPQRIIVGALGQQRFPAGWYLYVGSAQRGLHHRIERHFLPDKPLRWHIDYLTCAAAAMSVGAAIVPNDRMTECALNGLVAVQVGGQAPVAGFGATDCRAGCRAHLWYSARRLTPEDLVGTTAARGTFYPIESIAKSL